MGTQENDPSFVVANVIYTAEGHNMEPWTIKDGVAHSI